MISPYKVVIAAVIVIPGYYCRCFTILLAAFLGGWYVKRKLAFRSMMRVRVPQSLFYGFLKWACVVLVLSLVVNYSRNLGGESEH